MFEYRFNNLNENFKVIFDLLEISVIEEEIYGENSFIVYSPEMLDDFFIENNIFFQKKVVSDTGWDEKWKEFLRPGKLTENVAYVFDEKDVSRYSKSIIINPALAFGTGNHPTTKIAATLLEEVCSDMNVLDVGCGSGILSILASISGAKKVYGFDNDPVAILNARENILKNGCQNISLWAGEIYALKIKTEVVVANIISSVLLSLKQELYNKSNNYLILSGILLAEKDSFLKEFLNVNISIVKEMTQNEWYGVLLKRCI